MKRTHELKAEDETLDFFYAEKIGVLQKKRGYRFSVDAPLLADFIQTTEKDELLELGAGNAVISLLLSIKPFQHILGLEIQKELCDLARRNILMNNLGKRMAVIQGDLRTYNPGKKFDVVFSNPPYIKRSSGHLSSSAEKSIAKHEVKCDIFDIMTATSRLLKKGGRSYFVYATKRKEDFFKAAEESSLGVKAIRYVFPRRGDLSNLFLTECGFSSRRPKELPPLFLYGEDGKSSPEADQIFLGRISGPAF